MHMKDDIIIKEVERRRSRQLLVREVRKREQGPRENEGLETQA